MANITTLGNNYLLFGIIFFADVVSNCYSAVYFCHDIFPLKCFKPTEKLKV